ncbi:hypothetical protein D3C72_1557880 [compost metagenome]
MAELMRQHGLDLVGVKARQQGVEKHDPARPAEAGEIGVAMGRPARSVHHEQAVQRKAAALRQALDASGQFGVGERRELVEQGGDEHRVDDQQREVEHRPERPGPDPPVVAGAAHQPQHRGRQRQAQDRRDQQALGGIHREKPGRHAVETEARLQPELPP